MAAEWILNLAMLAILTALSWCGCQHVTADGTNAETVKREKIEIAGKTYELEVAAATKSRENGLMYRDHIDDDGGMIFIFPDTAIRSFWMKNCIIEIDVMFLDSQGRIVALHEMKPEPPQVAGESDARYEARLKRYSSGKRAQFAIELKAGSNKTLDLKLGQKLPLDLKRLKAMAK